MKNLKVRAKLITGFGLVLLMVVLLGITAITGNSKLTATTKGFASTSVPATTYVWTARRDLVSVQRYLLQMIATTDKKDFDEASDAMMVDRNDLDVQLGKIMEIVPEYKSEVEEINSHLAQAVPVRKQVVEIASRLDANSNAEAYRLFSESYVPLFNKARDTLIKLNDDIVARISQREAEADKTANELMVVVLLVLIGAVALTIIATLLITKSITTPIKELEHVADEMSQGRLGTQIKYQSKDELGKLADSMRYAMGMIKTYVSDITYAMNEFSHNSFVLRPPTQKFIGDFEPIEASIVKVATDMSDTLSQIRVAANQVSSGADQVSSGAQALAQGATEQASSVEELSASISEISHQVNQNAQNSVSANDMALQATTAITNSNEQMQKLMVAMDSINSKSHEISKIIKTIEDIAFQTNILALNAAVEAARAGSAGKGFAVVADEVRNLSGKSAEAAKNTTALIEDSVTAIADGVKLADITAKELLGAVDSVRETTSIISDITKASSDQAASISQVTIGVDQISAVVQTNSATSEQSAAASEELSSQATLLNDLISKFKLINSDNPSVKSSNSYQNSYSSSTPTEYNYSGSSKY